MKATNISIIIFSFLVCQLAIGANIEVIVREDVIEKAQSRRPDEVFIYELQTGDPGLWMERLAEMVGVRGKVKETTDVLSSTNGSRYLEVRKVSCSTFYGDMANLWKEEPTPENTRFNVPDNGKTKRMTMEWLSKLGFSKGSIEELEISISDEIFELTFPGEKEKPVSIIAGKNVEVRRRIDNHLVYGPGSKIKLYIGGNGEMNGLMAVWRQIIPASGELGHKATRSRPKGLKMKPISAKKAIEVLKAKPLDHLPLAFVDRIKVDSVDFGYYARSAAEPQKYLQPVYVFRGTAYSTLPNGKQTAVPYEQYCLALEKPLESIWPETKQFKSEPRREGEIPPRGKDVDEPGGSS